MPVVDAAAAAGPMDMASSSSSGTAGRSSFASLWWPRGGKGRTCGDLALGARKEGTTEETDDDEAWRGGRGGREGGKDLPHALVARPGHHGRVPELLVPVSCGGWA